MAVSALCRKPIVGNPIKLVCFDSKDRVLEKWGNPSAADPRADIWVYEGCQLKFSQGRLFSFLGSCPLTAIVNDSFLGDDQLVVLAGSGNSVQGLSQAPQNFCLNVRVGDPADTWVHQTGRPRRLETTGFFSNASYGATYVATFFFNTSYPDCHFYLDQNRNLIDTEQCPPLCQGF